MTVWLQYGLSKDNALVYVDEVASGRTALRCPYCTGPLTAKKGKKIAHHFAHTEQTCAAVGDRKDLPLLPLYTTFAFDLGRGALEELLVLWQEYGSAGHAAPEPRQSSLIDFEYLRFNRFMGRGGGYEFTKKGKVPVGGLSIPLFADLQQQHMIERLHQIEDRADDYLYYSQNSLFLTDDKFCSLSFPQALSDYRLYRAQLKRLLSQHLYYLKIEAAGACYYKIGVTARPIEDRLAEIWTELGRYISVLDITVLGLWQHCGRVEHYFKHRFREQNQPIGPLTEYFRFDPGQAKKVLRELRRLKSKQSLSEEEQFILSDESMPLEIQIEENKAAYYQEVREIERRKRRSRYIRRGMKRAAKRGKHVGRPKGNEAVDAFLAKPKNQAITLAIGKNLSLRQVREVTGASINTIRKVKAALGS